MRTEKFSLLCVIFLNFKLFFYTTTDTVTAFCLLKNVPVCTGYSTGTGISLFRRVRTDQQMFKRMRDIAIYESPLITVPVHRKVYGNPAKMRHSFGHSRTSYAG